MLFFTGFFVSSAAFTEIEKIFHNFFSNVPFHSSPMMFPSSLLISTISPCSLVDFGHVPLFPGTPKRPSILYIPSLDPVNVSIRLEDGRMLKMGSILRREVNDLHSGHAKNYLTSIQRIQWDIPFFNCIQGNGRTIPGRSRKNRIPCSKSQTWVFQAFDWFYISFHNSAHCIVVIHSTWSWNSRLLNSRTSEKSLHTNTNESGIVKQSGNDIDLKRFCFNPMCAHFCNTV